MGFRSYLLTLPYPLTTNDYPVDKYENITSSIAFRKILMEIFDITAKWNCKITKIYYINDKIVLRV